MARLLYLTGRSPFARKVRILLLEKGLPFDPVTVDLAARTPEFLAVSPLGKVPALVDEDGTVVFDSTVIAEYLEDRYRQPPMLGRTWAERLSNRALDELADTVAEQAVAAFYSRTRGEPAAEERAFALIRTALGELSARAQEDRWPAGFGLGDAAVISALGYLELRHGKDLLEAYPPLQARVAALAARSSVAATVPVL